MQKGAPGPSSALSAMPGAGLGPLCLFRSRVFRGGMQAAKSGWAWGGSGMRTGSPSLVEGELGPGSLTPEEWPHSWGCW